MNNNNSIEKDNERTNSLIIVYNNTDCPGFEFLHFNNQHLLIKNEKVKLDDDQLVGGLPLPTLNLDSLLKPYIPENIRNVTILLDSEQVYKLTNAYPKINRFKLKSLYQRDIKLMQGNTKEKVRSIIQEYHNNLGTIIYTYVIPNDLYNFAFKLGNTLNLKVDNVDYFGYFLFKNLRKQIDGNFIYAYGHNDSITLVISYSNVLSGVASFKKDDKALNRNVYGVGMKHFYELEKEPIEKLLTNITDIKCDVLPLEVADINLDLGSK